MTSVACEEVVSGIVKLLPTWSVLVNELIVGKDKTVVNLKVHNIVGSATGSSK
jgi:uncharacterized membrane protein (GlpM family)